MENTSYKRSELSKVGTNKVEWFLTSGHSEFNDRVADPDAWIKWLLSKHTSKDYINEIYVNEKFKWSRDGKNRPITEALQAEANLMDNLLLEFIEVKEAPIKNVFDSIIREFSKEVSDYKIIEILKDAQLTVLQKYAQQNLL